MNVYVKDVGQVYTDKKDVVYTSRGWTKISDLSDVERKKYVEKKDYLSSRFNKKYMGGRKWKK